MGIHEQCVCELNGFTPPSLWKTKNLTWHSRNKALKREIMQQGKLPQRIRNWFNGEKLTAAEFMWNAGWERSPAPEGFAAGTIWWKVQKAKFHSWWFYVYWLLPLQYRTIKIDDRMLGNKRKWLINMHVLELKKNPSAESSMLMRRDFWDLR